MKNVLHVLPTLLSILAIGIIMQQLNFLPTNAVQNVETKDGLTAILSPSLPNDFSQHIESHLAKNKGASEIQSKDSKEIIATIDPNVDNPTAEQKTVEAQSQVEKSPDIVNDLANALTDEPNPASDTQEVAAIGNNSEIKPSEIRTDGVKQGVDESELLMSFLTKVDKTLVEQGIVEQGAVDQNTIKFNGTSKEQKVTDEAQLLSKSSDLIAELSGVAKAIISSPESDAEYSFEPVKSFDLTNATSIKTKESTDINQLITKSSLDTNDLLKTNVDVEKLISEKSVSQFSKEALIQQNLTAGNDNIDLGDNVDVSNNVNKISILNDNKKVIKSSQSSQTTTQVIMTSPSVKASTFAQNLLENESSVDEKEGTLIENETLTANNNKQNAKGISKQADNITSAISSGQHSLSQSTVPQSTSPQSTSPQSTVSQHVVAKDIINNVSTENLGQATTEALAKETDLTESEALLSKKAVDHFVEQSKREVTGENKDISAKVMAKTNTDPSFNASALETSNRTILGEYDRIDHQAIDIVNSTGSAEVSQSQKTNIQLHHETIAIFRKDFSEAVKDKVMLMISQKLQQFDITLDPPELGNMQVRVNLQGEQATVNFVVQNQQAKEALDQNMYKLRDMLAEQGVDVGDANVEQQSNQSDNKETAGSQHRQIETNTADASDAVEHNLSARSFDSSAQVIDYYA